MCASGRGDLEEGIRAAVRRVAAEWCGEYESVWQWLDPARRAAFLAETIEEAVRVEIAMPQYHGMNSEPSIDKNNVL